MKSLLYLTFFFCFSQTTLAQNLVHGSYSSLQLRSPYTDVSPNGYQQINFNTVSNNANIITTSQTGRSIDHFAINKSNFIYAIEGVFNQDYNIISYDTKNGFSSIVAKTNISWDGGKGMDARTSGMGIDNNDNAWVVAYSVINGNNYLTSFTTSNTGTVSNIISSPYVLKTNFVSVQVTDIAFDVYNNLYALVLDLLTGYQYIYFVDANIVSKALPGSNIMLSLKWQIVNNDNVPIRYNPQFSGGAGSIIPFDSYMAEGLAFSENGNLLISVDKMSFYNNAGNIAGQVRNNIYALQYKDAVSTTVTISTIAYSGENKSALSFCTDLASNYYPVYLPTTFGNIAATVANNQLQIEWSTKLERNNKKFNIEVSKDGINFSNLDTQNSKATNGNANSELFYTINCDINKTPLQSALPIVFLFILLSIPAIIKRKIFACLLLSLFIIVGCSKGSKDNPVEVYTGKIFIKITAVDGEGISSSSKIVQAVR